MARALTDIYPTRQVEGYSEQHSTSAGSVTEAFCVPFATRISDVQLLLDSTHSDTVDFSDWICTGVSVNHTGWETGKVKPTKAILSVTYVDPVTGIQGSSTQPVFADWMEYWQSGGEALTIGMGCYWSDKGPTGSILLEDISTVRIFPQVQVTMTGKVTGAKFNGTGKAAILNTIGKTNSAAMTIKGFDYSIESLLFLGMDGNETADPNTGTSVYGATLKFAAMYDHTWNEFWDGSTFRKILASDGTDIYSSTAFSAVNPDSWTA